MTYHLKEGSEHSEGCREAKRRIAVGSSKPQLMVVCANSFGAVVGAGHDYVTVEGASLQPKVAIEACMDDWIPSRQVKHQRSLRSPSGQQALRVHRERLRFRSVHHWRQDRLHIVLNDR